METTSAKVLAFFSHPDRYLEDNHNITVRSLLVRELLGDVHDARILDLGCGDGSLSLQFLPHGNRVTMVDLSDAMLERAKSKTPPEHRACVDYLNVDLFELKPAEPYHVILCIGVLAHVDSVEGAIAKIAELLRPGGRCVVQITDCSQVIGRLLYRYYSTRASVTGSIGYALNRTTFPQIASIAASNSLRLVSVRRHVLLLPGMGRIPRKWLLKGEQLALKRRALSRHGASALLLFEKEA